MKRLAALTALTLLLGTAPAALAQKAPPKAAKGKADAKKADAKKADGKKAEPANDTIRAGEAQQGGGGGRVERKGGVKVYRLEEIKVEGRIQKPNAFYVLQRSSLNYELESLKQQFVPNILKSVSQSPF